MGSPRRLNLGKGTIILIASCIALLLLVPIAWLLLPLTKPATAEDARAELTAHVDAVVETIPVELVVSDEQSTSDVPCPTDDGVRSVQLRRVLVVDDAFDVLGWPATLRERFPAQDGWHVTRHIVDSAGTRMISVRRSDRHLINVQTVETDAGSELTMTSWSPCTAG